jgi:hypothetical protein
MVPTARLVVSAPTCHASIILPRVTRAKRAAVTADRIAGAARRVAVTAIVPDITDKGEIITISFFGKCLGTLMIKTFNRLKIIQD